MSRTPKAPPLICPNCGIVHWEAAPVLWAAWSILDHRGPMTYAELAPLAEVSKQGAQNLLTRLVAEGLAEKLSPAPFKRAARYAAITPKLASGPP